MLPELHNQIATHSSESVLHDKSVDSFNDTNQSEGSPYKLELKHHINNYIRSKNALNKSYLSSKGNRNKKFIFSKLERMRLLSESELRKILFKEIEENKRYLEDLNSKTTSIKMFKHQSIPSYTTTLNFNKKSKEKLEIQNKTTQNTLPNSPYRADNLKIRKLTTSPIKSKPNNNSSIPFSHFSKSKFKKP